MHKHAQASIETFTRFSEFRVLVAHWPSFYFVFDYLLGPVFGQQRRG